MPLITHVEKRGAPSRLQKTFKPWRLRRGKSHLARTPAAIEGRVVGPNPATLCPADFFRPPSSEMHDTPTFQYP